MSHHKSQKKALERQHFFKSKVPSETSAFSIFKSSLSYMNLKSSQPPTMYMYGNRCIYIEHFESIIEYNICHIRLQLAKMQMVLEGKELCLEYYSKHDLRISGTIEHISFSDGKGEGC